MTEPRTVTVVGATGRQGGALAAAILGEPAGDFAVRAVTRHPESPAARALERAGAEVVQADLDDPESLARAFEGAYGAYLVTNFWEHMSAEREKAQAEALARAAGHAGVRHAVWSTLEDTRACIPVDDDRMPTLQGRYKVPHFDAKAEADQYFADAGVPTTYLRPTFYWENLLGPFAPRRGEDGGLQLALPMGTSRLAGIAVQDIGRTALAILRRGSDLIGATVSIAGEALTLIEMAVAMSKVLGEQVTYRPVTPDAFRAGDFPGATEAGNMFQYYAECERTFLAPRDPGAARLLDPQLQDFADWLTAHRTELRAAVDG
ncbi:NmrA/HSCARG family protein [Kitasatospora sp. NPDC001539]|uniref:NmrA/HSCARG family protein n=1 Tax=Kitasatospora sp. NPDC001539 TaxID=3154384 RepID=UPI00332B64C3